MQQLLGHASYATTERYVRAVGERARAGIEALDGPRIERHLEILSSGAVERIRGMRGAVEHLEEKILKGEIEKGQAHTLLLGEDGIELAEDVISYDDLARWVVGLHDLGREVVAFRVDV